MSNEAQFYYLSNFYIKAKSRKYRGVFKKTIDIKKSIFDIEKYFLN